MSRKRLAYRGPNRKVALQFQSDSVADAAANLQQTREEFLHGLAEHYRVRLQATMDEVAAGRIDPQSARIDYAAEYARLCADDGYALDYRYVMHEFGFGDTITLAEDWLAASPSAQAMLDGEHLARFLGGSRRSAGKPPARMFGDAARRVQILPTISGGVQARAIHGERPSIVLPGGLTDALSYAATLAVGSSVHWTQSGPEVRDLRGDPPALIAAVKEMREILDLAAGKRADVELYVLSGPRRVLADALRDGAEQFVILHELAHLLLPARPDPHDEERKCDEFAVRTMCASGDEVAILGILLGLMVLATSLREDHAFIASASHPRFGTRMDAIFDLTGALGARPRDDWQGILSPPARLMEEAVFQTETRDRLLPNFAMRLRQQWEGGAESPWITFPMDATDVTPDAYWGTAASAILDRAVRLPTLEETTRRTWWRWEGFRFMLLVVDPMAAVAAARDALAGADLPDSANREEMACDAALAMLTFLGRNETPRRSLEALRAFHAIVSAESAGRRARHVGSAEREYLERIGAVSREEGALRIRSLVGLEFSVPAHWY